MKFSSLCNNEKSRNWIFKGKIVFAGFHSETENKKQNKTC